MKSRKMRHEARVADEKYIQFWSENLKGKNHLEDQGVYGKIVLKWILKK
jgi:hypothetical protein